MPTKAELEADLKLAMRGSQRLRVATLRMALAGVKLAEVDLLRPLSDTEMMGVLQREVSSRRETIEDARKAQRQDLIEQAQAEIDILAHYLPEPLSPTDLEDLAKTVINEVGAADMQAMGKVMGALKPRLEGRADSKQAAQVVRKLLGGE